MNKLNRKISNPYYGERKDFEFCFSFLKNACNKIVLDLSL